MPGTSNSDELAEVAVDRGLDSDRARGHLEQAVADDDVAQANGRYWVMRKGEYAFHEYDYPEP